MLQAVAAFSAGAFAQSGWQSTCASAPSCSAQDDDGGTPCRLSVRVHAVSVPALGEQGRLLRQRLRLAAGFAGHFKETEDAIFAGFGAEGGASGSGAGASGGGAAASSTLSRSVSGALSRAASAASLGGAAVGDSGGGGRSRQPPSGQHRKVKTTCGDDSDPDDVSCAGGLGAGGGCGTGSEGKSAVEEGVSDGSLWSFGDTITFALRPSDLRSGGMTLALRAQSRMRLGPLSVEMPHSAQELGEAVVDLRHRVLPICAPCVSVQQRRQRGPAWPPDGAGAPPGDPDDWKLGGFDCEFESPTTWESPILAVPLTRVSKSPHSGVEVAVVARAAVSFFLSTDPAVLLRELDDADRPLSHKFIGHVASCLVSPLASCEASCGPGHCAEGWRALPPLSSAASSSAAGDLRRRPAAPWVPASAKARAAAAAAAAPREPEEESDPSCGAFGSGGAVTDWTFRL